MIVPVKIFVEYKVKAEMRGTFIGLVQQLNDWATRSEARHFKIYEGTDQPLLFVEEFFVDNLEQYRRIKEERRTEQHPFWHAFHECVDGGARKINIWAFQEIRLNP